MGFFERLADRATRSVSEIRPVLRPMFGQFLGDAHRDDAPPETHHSTTVQSDRQLVRQRDPGASSKTEPSREAASPDLEFHREGTPPGASLRNEPAEKRLSLVSGDSPNPQVLGDLSAPPNRAPEMIREGEQMIRSVPSEREEDSIDFQTQGIHLPTATLNSPGRDILPAAGPLTGPNQVVAETRAPVLGLEPLAEAEDPGGSVPPSFVRKSDLHTRRTAAGEAESRVVHVTIGRVEVKAIRESSSRVPASPRPPRSSSLDEYLRARGNRKRR